jgi:hypothetical protein
VLTYDVDLWIDDTSENRDRTEDALSELGAQWGSREDDWRLVADIGRGWLSRQSVFCVTSAVGAIDIFRAVRGLESWSQCRDRAYAGDTGARTPYFGLSDADMLTSQMALPEPEQKQDRIRTLRAAIARYGP